MRVRVWVWGVRVCVGCGWVRVCVGVCGCARQGGVSRNVTTRTRNIREAREREREGGKERYGGQGRGGIGNEMCVRVWGDVYMCVYGGSTW